MYEETGQAGFPQHKSIRTGKKTLGRDQPAIALKRAKIENGSYLGSPPLPVPPCSSAESVLRFTTPASESGGDKWEERERQGVRVRERERECVSCGYIIE